MDAPEYDPAPARRRNRLVLAAVIGTVMVLVLYFSFRFWPEERVINAFFQAIEHKDFEKAYGLYNADPGWKAHPQEHPYSLKEFSVEWGPSGNYGEITSHHIDCSTEPHRSGFQSASGIIVVVTVNGRPETMSMWVEKKTKEIHRSPIEAECRSAGR
ncbi:MAG TPA: hypothetical protein VNW97_09400 [Candidatus Saccharimonadales bacterium]|nr:hypothetical protein [Candidatus Saccharimonadales bacterium]